MHSTYFISQIKYGLVSKSFLALHSENMKTNFHFSSFGLVAHLVERLICTEEVAGSSPVESTNLNHPWVVFIYYGLEGRCLRTFRQDLKDGSIWLCHS